MANTLYLKDAVDYLSSVTNMSKIVAEEHLLQFCNCKIKITSEPCNIDKTIKDMADFLDVDMEIAKTVWYKMRFEGDVNDMCKCRFEDREAKYARMISHYDIELRDYKKFIDVLETVADVNPEKVTQLIKDFKKGHKEYSDDNPVEFENEES